MAYIDELREHAIEYGSIPFWSWNDRLEPERLRSQIRDMHDLGMNGFFMHARSGLETEYLGEEWYECIEACIDEAKKLGMEAWSYDENGWPSGFAGGILLEDPQNHAKYLTSEIKKEFDSEALAVYVIENNKSRRVTEYEGEKDYFTVYRRTDESYVDTLDGDITRKFIEATHAQYKERFEADFGKTMPGFFTDEPQYYRYQTVWSDTLPVKFRAKYGYDVLDGLDALFTDFDGAREFRYDYWRICHELFIENFVKLIYDWCEENGCQLTGHGVEETFMAGQMWCCGGIMPFYEYEHIPGMDHLGRPIDQGVASKQLGSVCAQLGKKRVLSEMYGCCGWDVSPKELKAIAESQYVAGINLMCQHLYPYSERGQRKRDYPAHYSQHLPWQKKMKEFDEYFNRLGYTLSRGKEIAPVLLIHPIHSVWLDYKRTDDSTAASIDGPFCELTRKLYDAHIGFHFGDEELTVKYGSVRNGILTVGQQDYKYVIIPKLYSLDSGTVALLKEFVSQGGKILLADAAPDRIDGKIVPASELSFLKSNTNLDEIRENTDIVISREVRNLRCMLRETDRGRLAFVANLSPEELAGIKIGLKGAKHLNRLNLETGLFEKLDTKVCPGCGALYTEMILEPGESVLITEFEGEEEIDGAKLGYQLEISEPFKAAGKVENLLTLDHAELSYDGMNFERNRPVELIRDILYRSRYKGKVWLKFGFDVAEVPESLGVALEPMNLVGVTVNGTVIKVDKTGWFDPSFLSASIADLLKVGSNDVTVCIDYWQRDYVYHVLFDDVMESLRNCLVFDTEIEDIYLFGDFALDTPGTFTPSVRNSVIYEGPVAIKKASGNIDMGSIVESGYPFFAGKISFESTVDYDGSDSTELYLAGRFSVAEIYVNGVFAGTLMFKNHLNLAAFLRKGENSIRVDLYNSNRNMMGPHHRSDPEFYALGPVQFSYEKEWNGEECPDYFERYAFVKFGAKM